MIVKVDITSNNIINMIITRITIKQPSYLLILFMDYIIFIVINFSYL